MEFESKDFKDQIALLRERGMEFKKPDKAENTLHYISYYKIKEFAEPFVKVVDGKKVYQEITFEEVIERYYRDKNLRLHILHAIEDIEVALQTQIAYNLGKNTGAYGYLRINNWADFNNFSRKKLTKRQEKIKSRIKEQVRIARSNPDNYKELINKLQTNEENDYPPIWLGINLLMFGNLVYMLEVMNNRNKKPIANYFDCSTAELYSWMRILNLVRNKSAHNSNFIDMKFITSPPIRDEWRQFLFMKDDHLFTDRISIPIIIIKHFMNQINYNYRFDSIKRVLFNLIKTDKEAQYYGFASKKAVHELFRK
ncbi:MULTISPECIES: Abi family protein [Aerococcus]|uniref:Abi family protein n=1 Tax=Aerococcus sanguinicola TaxID=119206 RepID=A0A5N1GK18_9LACT|nr:MULTISPECIES: Abi family protein [Aerococcus]KAA9300638.1 Abi family protein [Aerococcus sanguinicola]MDK6370119.1 Abi family protein [Aerococcus sp. UMB9870]MDK6680064.1 Abi family protein [Aerococcus sp. UMB8608]MDK6686225.1 Abi family protein [Aerococcus sp. UMB8623]MDK6939952.1 Abi family protein [Aerococcus sp. UMB8487]